jgi:hypothetical protein
MSNCSDLQYINGIFPKLIIDPEFFKKHKIRVPNQNEIYINHLTRSAVVFSVVYGDDVYVFCCKVNVPAVRQGGEIEIEITSETVMSHFTENLSSRLPMNILTLCGIQNFLHDKPDFYSGDKRKVDVIELNKNLFVVMFDSTLYFFQLTHSSIQCLWLSLSELNKDDYDCRIDFDFSSFRCYEIYSEYNDSTELKLLSTFFNDENSFLQVILRIEFNSSELNRRVECSRALITHNDDIGGLFSTTYDAEPHNTPATNMKLKVKSYDDDSEEDDEDDSDKEDDILVVPSNEGNRYIFRQNRYDDCNFFCILFLNGIIYLLEIERDDLDRLKFYESDELIGRFERDLVNLSKILEGFGEVDFSCKIVMAAEPNKIQITCDFYDSRRNLVLTKEFIIDPVPSIFMNVSEAESEAASEAASEAESEAESEAASEAESEAESEAASEAESEADQFLGGTEV